MTKQIVLRPNSSAVSSNILINEEFNAKVSDFGLAKLLGAGKSHITTRFMGTFGYVAPEYANTGLLNEKSDVYSFGVLLLEAITGRDPVDYGRSAPEVNLVDWLKMMVGSRRSEEVVDPNIETRPSTRALKRALLTALRCVDPDSDKRPRMSQVVRMLESEEYPIPREDRRHKKTRANSVEVDSQGENYDTDESDGQDLRSVNLEYLGRVVFNTDGILYPDDVVGTDSHTTMIDGLGVAGWGVGGIEAESAMLGQMYGGFLFVG
ncbi:hypothetical protein ACS0TY_031307 [Phlomoides rotata]